MTDACLAKRMDNRTEEEFKEALSKNHFIELGVFRNIVNSLSNFSVHKWGNDYRIASWKRTGIGECGEVIHGPLSHHNPDFLVKLANGTDRYIDLKTGFENFFMNNSFGIKKQDARSYVANNQFGLCLFTGKEHVDKVLVLKKEGLQYIIDRGIVCSGIDKYFGGKEHFRVFKNGNGKNITYAQLHDKKMLFCFSSINGMEVSLA